MLTLCGLDAAGKLMIPRGAVEPFLQDSCRLCQTVGKYIADFGATWQADGALQYVPAVVEERRTNNATPSATPAPPPPSEEFELPSTAEVVYKGSGSKPVSKEDLQGILCEHPSKCQKYSVIVCRDGSMWLHSTGNPIAVSRNQRVAGFGSGGLRSSTEAGTARANNQVVLPFVLTCDTSELLITLPEDIEKPWALHQALATLTLKGYPDIHVPLHKLTRLERTASSTRDECSTHVCSWVQYVSVHACMHACLHAWVRCRALCLRVCGRPK